jgi:hypothetical protein
MTSSADWDLLLYVRSIPVVRDVLPPEARDDALEEMASAGWVLAPTHLGIGAPGTSSASVTSRGGREPVVDHEIPESEEAAVRRVWDLAGRTGRRLHLVDVGKESVLRRVIAEHLHHLHEFPVLVRRDRERLEGAQAFTTENLERFLSK